MPKKFAGKRGNGKKKFVKGVKTTYQIANKALDMAMKVKRLVNVEIKYHDNLLSQTPDTTGSVVSLHDINQGDTSLTREGSSIKVLRMSGRFTVQGNAAATNDTFVRIYIMRGKHERGSSPSWANTFEAAQGSNQQMMVPKLWNTRFNTKMIYSRLIRVTPNNDSESQVKFFTINKKLFGHIQYTQGANTAQTGGFYWFSMSNQATNTPSVIGTLRLTFTDN